MRGKWNVKGRTRPRHKTGVMNKLETDYYLQEIKPRILSGEYALVLFEQVTLKIATDTRYTPDFFVVDKDGYGKFIEVKGFWEDDALVKIKVAAELIPFDFIAIQRIPKKDGGGWKIREFLPSLL